MTDSIGLMS